MIAALSSKMKQVVLMYDLLPCMEYDGFTDPPVASSPEGQNYGLTVEKHWWKCL